MHRTQGIADRLQPFVSTATHPLRRTVAARVVRARGDLEYGKFVTGNG
ncbi:MAG: hypothetical protein IPG74_07980 [Flavobacteriales bacterium]|nr:hypothetical protein [Flavobacteriales bacterium]